MKHFVLGLLAGLALAITACTSTQQAEIKSDLSTGVSLVHGLVVDSQKAVASVASNETTYDLVLGKVVALTDATGELHSLATTARGAIENGDVDTANTALQAASAFTAPPPQ